MKLLFVKGEKGLTANKDGKFYFPNRGSEITEEGLYECEIAVEKNKYAFVYGKPVKTEEPSIAFMEKMLHKELFDKSFWSKIETFSIKKIGFSNIMFVEKNGITEISYIKESDTSVFVTQFDKDYPKDYNVAKLYAVDKFDDIADFMDMRVKAIKDAAMQLTEENRLNAIAAIICSFRLGKFNGEFIDKITIYENKFVEIFVKSKCTKTTEKVIFAYSEEYSAFKIQMELGNMEKTSTVEPKDIENWMIQNKVGFGETFGSVCVKTIVFMGNSLNITYFNGSNVFKATKEDAEAVKRSFEELEAFRKKVGKNVSKSMLFEFTKLAPKNILELDFC